MTAVSGFEQREQRGEILCRRSFPNHNPLSPAKLFYRLGRRAAFMIGTNPRRNICIQSGSGKSRCVTVYNPAVLFRIQNLIQNSFFSLDGSVSIHYLRKPQNTVSAVIRLKVIRTKNCSRLVKPCCRDTGRQNKIYIQRKPSGLIQHIFQSVKSGYIRNLMRIRNNGRRPVRHHGPGKFYRRYHGAFKVNMSVNKTRTDIPARKINLCSAGIASDSDNIAVLNRNIRFLCLIRKHIHDSRILQHKLRLRACRRLNPSPEALPFLSVRHKPFLSALYSVRPSVVSIIPDRLSRFNFFIFRFRIQYDIMRTV